MSFIIGVLLASLFNTFLVFVFINFLSKKKLSLNVRALLTFFLVMVIDFSLDKFSGNKLMIVDSLVFNGISIIVAYYYFKRAGTKKPINGAKGVTEREQQSEFAEEKEG